MISQETEGALYSVYSEYYYIVQVKSMHRTVEEETGDEHGSGE